MSIKYKLHFLDRYYSLSSSFCIPNTTSDSLSDESHGKLIESSSRESDRQDKSGNEKYDELLWMSLLNCLWLRCVTNLRPSSDV